MAELETDHALTFDFTTPHTKWAKPYARGKIRVLFFTNGTGTNPRECVELMERFDLDAQAVFWAQIVDSKESHWHGGELGERRMMNLVQQKWDCFVFLGLPMSSVPSAQKQIIRDAVTQGAGIVFTGPGDDALLEKKNRIILLPTFIATETKSQAYAIGKGRGMCLPNRPNIDYYEGWEIDYDYWQERLGRAVVWAAGKEPTTQLDLSSSLASPSTGQGLIVTSASPCTVFARLSGKPIGRNLRIQASVRKPGHTAISLPEREIIAGWSVEFLVPRLPRGTWHVDATVMGSAGIEAWATMALEVQSQRSVLDVKLNRNWSEPGGTISGTVALWGNPLPHELLRVQLLDRRRRELLRKDFTVADRPLAFEFEVPEWLPMLVTVEARLLSEGVEVDRAYKYFHVTKRHRDQFNFLMWDVPKGTLAPYAEENLARLGVTLQLAWGNPPLHVAAFDVSWVPYTTRITVEKNRDGVMKPFCWNDENAVKKETTSLSSVHRGSREHGAFAYSLGDENNTLGSCLSPYCANAYRMFLQESYGSLNTLNRSWQTEFKSWDEVGLSMARDDDELASKTLKNYPRWFDRQAYKSWNYVRYCLKYAKAYKSLDSRAVTGFEGAGGFAAGDDIDLIVRSLDFWSPPPGLADEVVRSVAARRFIRSNWVGYTKDADSLLAKYWRMVTLGMDSVSWWRWDCIGRFHGWLAPDLRPYPALKEILEDTQTVRDGLGDLLLHSTMQDDGIAILYSYPSVFAHKLDEGVTYGSYEDAHSALIKFVRDSGFQFRYVTDRMLRLGEFDASKYRILFLPRAEAIGDQEAQVIRNFVQAGGTVVADLRPGIYDDHCKPREKRALDDLFGIKRISRAAALSVDLTEAGSVKKISVDPGIRLADAQALQFFNGTPLLITRKTGKGRAILLNSQMSSLRNLLSAFKFSDAVTGAPQHGVSDRVFWGFSPMIKIGGVAGGNPKNIEITRWRDGGIDIVSFFRQGGIKEKITVSLPKERFVYDLRTRKALGPCKGFTTTILPNRASFFALMDSTEHAPKIEPGNTTAHQGSVLKARLSLPSAKGLHAVKMQIQAGGRHLQWNDKVLTVGKEPVEVNVPIAFNDPVGDYQIVLIDLFTSEPTITPVREVSDWSTGPDNAQDD